MRGLRTTFTINFFEYPVLNLTPHEITWHSETGKMFLKSDGVLRLNKAQNVEKIKFHTNQFFENIKSAQQTQFVSVSINSPWTGLTVVDNTKKNFDKVVLIVSMPVANYICDKKLYKSCIIMTQDRGPESAVRDKKGQIVGVKNLVLYRG